MKIRQAQREDATSILDLIHGLALYEKAPEQVVATLEDIERSLFTEHPIAFCHVAEIDHKVVGIAIWFKNYSTWLGQPGIYLEDLFVLPEFRKRGVGSALMKHLARLCVELDYKRFQWWVLDWNTPAIDFYHSMGAVPMDEWTVFRLAGDALKDYAARDVN